MVDGTKMYTSSSDALHVEQRDAQLWIRFNRPTLNYAMLEALTTCVLEATHDDQIRALIVNVSATVMMETTWGPGLTDYDIDNPEGRTVPVPLSNKTRSGHCVDS